MAHEEGEPRKLERFVDQKMSNNLEVVDLVPQFSNREVNCGDHKGKHDMFNFFGLPTWL